MNVLFLTKYSGAAASTRHRYLQFLPYLEQAGIHGVVSPLLDDEYLRRMFAGGKPRLAYLRALVRRTLDVATSRRFDRVVVHCEAYPYLPPVFEWYLQKGKARYVYDFDDAIFHQYDTHPNRLVRLALSGKIRRVIEGASAVIAGNDYLAEYARRVNDRVSVIPTVVDTDQYRLPEQATIEANRPLVVGWIGSPSTAPYVAQQSEALRTFCARRRARVVLVGSGPVALPGVPLEVRPWREQREVRDLQDFDVGIMPLPDTPWARGKCGFKLVQYMACGVPVVASPVGVNTQMVESGVNGYLATTPAEWLEALEKMAGDPSHRKRMGTTGRRQVIERYSLQSAAPRLAETLARG
jgi:glycosyltransferase involved in cell wall biosynthesis